MRDEFLDLIESLEQQADRRMAEARAEADEIRQAAQTEAAQIVQAARNQRRDKQGSRTVPESSDTDQVSASAVQVFKQEASQRQAKAVQAILKALEE